MKREKSRQIEVCDLNEDQTETETEAEAETEREHRNRDRVGNEIRSSG